MPDAELADELAAGRMALVERRWFDAIGHLQIADETQSLDGDDLDGLGEASCSIEDRAHLE